MSQELISIENGIYFCPGCHRRYQIIDGDPEKDGYCDVCKDNDGDFTLLIFETN